MAEDEKNARHYKRRLTMSGYNDYAVLYDMMTEQYDERLQKAERERFMQRFFARKNGESTVRRLSAAIERVGLAFVLFGMHVL